MGKDARGLKTRRLIMLRIHRALFLVPLLCTLGLGCHSTSSQKVLIPNGTPKNDVPLPPPAPPSWEGPNKTVYTPPQQPNATLAPKMELAWYIYSGQQSNSPVMAGQSQVGPDGTLLIGPYGQYQVGGLTVAQASQVIQSGVRQYQPNTPNSRVQLQLVSALYPQVQSGYPANAPGKPEATTWSSPEKPKPGSIKPVNYSGPEWTPIPYNATSNYTTPQSVTAVPPVAPPTNVEPQRHNKRSPIMTYFFGPRY
jgi:hypothetical protein